jgi:endonuclease/exonuclease/phosphatase family metal-dependent hydrolase
VAFDPYLPYGPVVDTTVRVVTWNVWGRYGEWEARQRALEAEVAHAQPDIVCLVEAWSANDDDQPARVAAALGFEHSWFDGDWQVDEWTSGIGMVSRWPITAHEARPLPGDGRDGAGRVLFTSIDAPRGLLQLFVAVLDYPLSASARRQAQVRQLCAFVDEVARQRHLTIVCGDFNAGPDSDEIRMLTGRSATAVPGLVFYDAWEIAGNGTAGITWSNRNPLAAIGHYPDRRFDYILSAWPRAGAAGHPVHCELLGVRSNPNDAQVSDHYGVLADLRY